MIVKVVDDALEDDAREGTGASGSLEPQDAAESETSIELEGETGE